MRGRGRANGFRQFYIKHSHLIASIMRGQLNRYPIINVRPFRMVVQGFGAAGHLIDKGHCRLKIFKAIGRMQGIILPYPFGQGDKRLLHRSGR